MKPLVLVTGFFLFFICLAVHIAVWRFYHPRRHAVTLFLIFLFPLVLFPIFFAITKSILSGMDWIAIGLLHLSLSFAYIQVYPASQADSPSFRILLLVERSMPKGMSEMEIQACFTSKQLLEERVQDLLIAGLVRKSRDDLFLTSYGQALIFPFITLRKILGLPTGQG